MLCNLTLSTLWGDTAKRMDHYKPPAFQPALRQLPSLCGECRLSILALTFSCATRDNGRMHGLPFFAALTFATPSMAAAPASSAPTGSTIVALFIFLVVAWISFRVVTRALRARKAQATVGEKFENFVLEALANAAGVATFVTTPPASSAGKTFLFQAVEPASCRASQLVSELL